MIRTNDIRRAICAEITIAILAWRSITCTRDSNRTKIARDIARAACTRHHYARGMATASTAIVAAATAATVLNRITRSTSVTANTKLTSWATVATKTFRDYKRLTASRLSCALRHRANNRITSRSSIITIATNKCTTVTTVSPASIAHCAATTSRHHNTTGQACSIMPLTVYKTNIRCATAAIARAVTRTTNRASVEAWRNIASRLIIVISCRILTLVTLTMLTNVNPENIIFI